MISKYYSKREHFLYFTLVVVGFFVLIKAYGATTIGTNVQTDGSVLLSNSAGTVLFSNGWKFSQTSATTSQISVTDSVNSPVLIFDEN